ADLRGSDPPPLRARPGAALRPGAVHGRRDPEGPEAGADPGDPEAGPAGRGFRESDPRRERFEGVLIPRPRDHAVPLSYSKSVFANLSDHSSQALMAPAFDSTLAWALYPRSSPRLSFLSAEMAIVRVVPWALRRHWRSSGIPDPLRQRTSASPTLSLKSSSPSAR